MKVVRRESTIRARGQDVVVMNHVFYNPARGQKERKQRQECIAAARAAVAEVQAQVDAGRIKQASVIRRRAKNKLKKHKVHALFEVAFDARERRIILKLREEVLAQRALLDGKFVLQTTEVAWSSEKTLTTYRGHDEAEKAIQDLKQIVPVRPIRHWNERRVAAHIFLSILACLVLAVLRYLARKIGLRGGGASLLELLRKVRGVVIYAHIGEVVIPQVSLTGLTEDGRRLLEWIGVSLPEPPEPAWVAVRLEAERGFPVAVALGQ